MTKKIIYFVRHGQCQANADGVIAGSQDDSPLTEKGIAQANETAAALDGKPIDVIVASPLIRAQETAKRIAEHVGFAGKILTAPLLIERDFGAASGRPVATGFEDIDAGRVADIETLEQLAARMQQALDWLKTLPGEHILAVGHGGAERMMRTVYEGRSPQTFLQTEDLHNGNIREYRLDT